jgi:universal stress protein A
MFKRILVPLDGSKLAEKALPYAGVLAQKFEAELILVRVLQLTPEIVGGPRSMVFHQEAVEDRHEAEGYLRDRVSQLRELHLLPARTVILENPSVAAAMIDLACQEKVDLIVMSTHGRSGLSRLVHGSVAGKVLEQAPCPVFLVKASESDCGERS